MHERDRRTDGRTDRENIMRRAVETLDDILTCSGVLAIFTVDVCRVIAEQAARELVQQTGLSVYSRSTDVQWVAIQ